MSLLAKRLAPRIVEEDGAFRTRMLGIAAGVTDLIALGRGDPDFHTPALEDAIESISRSSESRSLARSESPPFRTPDRVTRDAGHLGRGS